MGSLQITDIGRSLIVQGLKTSRKNLKISHKTDTTEKKDWCDVLISLVQLT